jgi:hypothetical protein
VLEILLQTNNNIDIVCVTLIVDFLVFISFFAFVKIVLENDITIYNLSNKIIKVFRNLILKYLSL